jgi:hypothetical protein
VDKKVAASLRDVKFENVGTQLEAKSFVHGNEFIEILASRRIPIKREGSTNKKMALTDLETLLQQATSSQDLPALFASFNISTQDGENLVKYFAFPEVETIEAQVAPGSIQSGSTQRKLVAKWPKQRFHSNQTNDSSKSNPESSHVSKDA